MSSLSSSYGKGPSHRDCRLRAASTSGRVRHCRIEVPVDWPRAGLGRRYHLALKREVPTTRCTECGAAGYNPSVANGRCNKIIGGERCHGINQSATNIADWEECAYCRATGFERNKICSQCRGVGFLFVGKIEPA